MTSIQPVGEPTTEQITAWHAVVAACYAKDLPGVPAPGPEQLFAVPLRSRILRWTAVNSDDRMVGVASARLSADRFHPASLDLHVDPDHRRLGVGSRLFAAVLEAVRDDRRRSLVAEVFGGTPGEQFLEAKGFRCVLALTSLLLHIDELDPGPLAEPSRLGYRLVRWMGEVPPEYADAFAVAKDAMAEPTGEPGYRDIRWDADRLREMAAVVANRGDALHTVAVVSEVDGTIAGFTEIVVPGHDARRAQQYDTLVVPAHRGRGLGLWVKAAMLDWLRAERPDVREIETDNADSNVHMLAVNERLGFRAYRRTRDYQIDL